jgi:tetratricopeptide (TPR) repeat protein
MSLDQNTHDRTRRGPGSLARAVAVVSVAAAAALAPATPAAAQEIDGAISAYNQDKYFEAAFLFYDVIQNSNDPDARVKAEFYIAQSLYKAGLYYPAMIYFGEVFNAGRAHPYFIKSTSGLLRVATKLGDDTLIPEVINRGYGNFDESTKPSYASLNAINYLIGMITQRRGNYAEAKEFLEAVGEKSRLYVKARYLLAIMAVKQTREAGGDNYDEALGYFDQIETKLANGGDAAAKKLYRLALLGKARAYFSQGDWAKSIEYYEKVPRFSDDWYDAMYESGWAYFQNGAFGRALGMVHAIQSPYFDDRYRAESWVLKATTYFQLCHFDRGRKALDELFRIYEPMGEQLKPFLEGDLSDADMVELVAKGNEKFPNEIRTQILSNRRFKKFFASAQEADREIELAKGGLPDGGFRAYILDLLNDQREQRLALTGKLVREQLRREGQFLDSFLNQGRIIKFETADAERKMLESGKDITKGPRARGPRPDVPSSKYQYWAFSGEYWVDEMGFFEHSIKNECIPEVFE